LTIIQTVTTNIVIEKQIDAITIKDIEDILAGTSPLPVTITIRRQTDELIVVRPPTDTLTIKD
jgi:hypothetical protein